MMHTAIHALCIDNRSGTGRYVFGLIDGFIRSEIRDLCLTVFVPVGFRLPLHWQLCDTVRFFSIPANNAIHRIYWEQCTLPALLQRLGIHTLHSPAFISPCLRQDSIRHIITVHDTAYYNHPETISFFRRSYLKWMIQRSIQRASAVITDSQAIADELQAITKTPVPIHPIHLAVDETHFHPRSTADEKQTLGQYPITSPYFLFVGTIEPRKNIETILDAYQQARKKGLQQQLVIVGRYGWLVNQALLQQDGVIWLGHIEEAHLPVLYRNAEALLAPSIYEGFDLPTVEALACGLRVIASDIAVHREVLKDTALLIPPTDTKTWTDALLQPVSSNPAGHPPRTWVNTAQETVDVFRKYSS